MELGQVEQWRIGPERVFAVRLEVRVDLVSVGAREELDRGAFGVGGGVLVAVRRRHVSKVESRRTSGARKVKREMRNEK